MAENTMAGQYLTFKLEREVYALEIRQVREVLDFTEITQVPGMPEFTRGIINLRESVVPVVDLKLKFDMPKTQKSMDTCIIIIDFSIDGEASLMGVLADSVQEVLTLESDRLEPVSKMGSRLKSGYIKGIGKKEGQFIIILDLEKIFSLEEIQEVAPPTEMHLPEGTEAPDSDQPEKEEETSGNQRSI